VVGSHRLRPSRLYVFSSSPPSYASLLGIATFSWPGRARRRSFFPRLDFFFTWAENTAGPSPEWRWRILFFFRFQPVGLPSFFLTMRKAVFWECHLRLPTKRAGRPELDQLVSLDRLDQVEFFREKGEFPFPPPHRSPPLSFSRPRQAAILIQACRSPSRNSLLSANF